MQPLDPVPHLSCMAALTCVVACSAQAGPDYVGEPLVTLGGQVESRLESVPEQVELGLLWLTPDPDGPCGPQPMTSAPSSSATLQAPTAEGECFDGCDADYPDGGAEYDACFDTCVEQSYAEATAEVDCFNACGADFPDRGEEWVSCAESCGPGIEAESSVSYMFCASAAINQTTPVTGDFPAKFSLDLLVPPPAEALQASEGVVAAVGLIVAVEPGHDSERLDQDSDRSWVLGSAPDHALVYAPSGIDEDSPWGQFLDGPHAAGYHLVVKVPGTDCGSWDSDGNFIPPGESSARPSSADELPNAPACPAGPSEPADSGCNPSPPALTPLDFEEVDFSEYADICGNGECEAGEDEQHCSDCDADGESTGILSSELESYYCSVSPNTLTEAPAGLDTDIRVVLAPVGEIRFPL